MRYLSDILVQPYKNLSQFLKASELMTKDIYLPTPLIICLSNCITDIITTYISNVYELQYEAAFLYNYPFCKHLPTKSTMVNAIKHIQVLANMLGVPRTNNYLSKILPLLLIIIIEKIITIISILCQYIRTFIQIKYFIFTQSVACVPSLARERISKDIRKKQITDSCSLVSLSKQTKSSDPQGTVPLS